MGVEMLSNQFDDYLVSYEADRVLFEEGSQGDSFYLIKDGLVDVTKQDPEGGTIQLDTAGPGEVLGEMALLGDDQKRSATVRTQTKLECWEFTEKQFNGLLKESQEFRNQMLQLMSERLQATNEKLVDERHRRNLLHQAAGLLLYLLEDRNLYDRDEATLNFSPSLRDLRDIFDLSAEALETLLGNLSTESLRSFQPDVQTLIEETSLQVLENGLEKIELRTPFSADETEISMDFKSLDDAIRTAKELYNHLRDRRNKSLERSERAIYDQYRSLCDKHESARNDPTTPTTKTSQLKAYVDGLREELIERSIVKEE